MSTQNTTVTVDGWPLLNPFSSSVFLSPEMAHEMQIARYILVGASGAFVWDFLYNIRNDFIFASRQGRWGLPTIVYFLSKLSSLGFVIFSAVFQTAPISDCYHGEKALSVLFSVAVPSTTLLFLFRACAVFGMNPFAILFFGVLWLAVLGGCLTTIPGLTGVNIGPTSYCLIGGLQAYAVSGVITPLINGTIVFFAISWRLWHNTWARRTIKNGVRVMIFGDYLPTFSRSMLQDGQVYFLTTVTANLLTVVMAFVTSLSSPYRTVFTVPNAALMNIMACRVHQRTMLEGSYRGDFLTSSHHPVSSPAAPIPLWLIGARMEQGAEPTANNLAVNHKTVQYDDMV